MFWERWIPKKYLVRSIVCGLEVQIGDAGTDYHFTILKKQKNKLEVLESGSSENAFELPKKIKKDKIPLVISINGKGLILKKVNFNSEEELSKPDFIQQNLPAINPADFCIQVYKQNNNTGFISVFRKEQLEKILLDIVSKKVEISDVFIGPANIMAMTPVIGKYSYVYTGIQKIELLNNNIEGINNISQGEEKDKNIDLDNTIIKPEFTLSFSSGFSYLTDQTVCQSQDQELTKYKKNHLEKNKLKVLTYFFVSIAFVICLSNFLFFSNYFSKDNKLQSELDAYEGKHQQIEELLSNYEKKKSLIEGSGVMDNKTISKYVDKIVGTIPDEIILTDFYINPVKSDDTTADTLTNFEKNTIIIKGNYNKSMLLNEWLSVLKMQNFIKDANLENFTYNKEGMQPNFKIKITID